MLESCIGHIYSSYKDSLQKLTENNLEYLDQDLNRIYNKWCKFWNNVEDYMDKHPDLRDNLIDVVIKTDDCFNVDSLDVMLYFFTELEVLWLDLERSPKNSTCYKNLNIYFKAIKQIVIANIRNNEIIQRAFNYWDEVEAISDYFNDRYLSVFYVMISAECNAELYVKKMIQEANKTDNKEVIRRASQTLIEKLENDVDDYWEEIKEGYLNVDYLRKLIEDYRQAYENCTEFTRELSLEMVKVKDLILSSIATIEKYSNARIYIIDEDRSKVFQI